MKRIIILITILFAFMSTMSAQRQYCIKGHIETDKGDPVACVNVMEKGTMNGTLSDFDGYYELTVSVQQGTLEFSLIGFLTKECPFNIPESGTLILDVTIETDAETLEHVKSSYLAEKH